MQYTLSPVVLIKQAGKACVRTIVSTIATSHFHKVVLVHQNTRFLCVCSKSHERSFPVTPSVHVAGRVRKLGCCFTAAREPPHLPSGPMRRARRGQMCVWPPDIRTAAVPGAQNGLGAWGVGVARREKVRQSRGRAVRMLGVVVTFLTTDRAALREPTSTKAKGYTQ